MINFAMIVGGLLAVVGFVTCVVAYSTTRRPVDGEECNTNATVAMRLGVSVIVVTICVYVYTLL